MFLFLFRCIGYKITTKNRKPPRKPDLFTFPVLSSSIPDVWRATWQDFSASHAYACLGGMVFSKHYI